MIKAMFLIQIFLFFLFLQNSHLAPINECGLQAFTNHPCFKNGVLLCKNAKILVVHLHARAYTFEEPDDNADIIRSSIFHQILYQHLNPCSQTIFNHINISYADELGIYKSFNYEPYQIIQNNTSIVIPSDQILIRYLSKWNDSLLIETFKKYFLTYADKENTLNIAYVFTDSIHDQGSDFLYYCRNKSEEFVIFFTGWRKNSRILNNFLKSDLFYQSRELAHYAAEWIPLKEKSKYRVDLIFMEKKDVDKFNQTGLMSNSICGIIENLQKSCKQNMFAITNIIIPMVILVIVVIIFVILIKFPVYYLKIKRRRKNGSVCNSENDNSQNDKMSSETATSLLEPIETLIQWTFPQLNKINGINILKFPDSATTYDFKKTDFMEETQIGQGQFRVDKVIHIPTGNQLAIKSIMIPINSYDDRNTKLRLQRIQQEIESSKKLSRCPNIVTFYGFCIRELNMLICMELMDFSLKDLYKKVHKKGKNFSEKMIGYITISIIDAMTYCKNRKIMHRDIKPPNVLLNKKGEIKLCDFGESRILEDSLATTHVGTISYWPPERFNWESLHEPYDIRSDVWSLGITILEIIVGKLPYLHPSPTSQNTNQTFFLPMKITNFDSYNYIKEHIAYKYSDKLRILLICCLEQLEKRPKITLLKQSSFYLNYKRTCYPRNILNCLNDYLKK